MPAPVLTGTRSDYNPPSLAAGESDSFTITVTGAAIGDHVSVAPSASIGTLMKDADVSGTNTVTVKLFNPSDAVAAVDLAALVWTAKVTKK